MSVWLDIARATTIKEQVEEGYKVPEGLVARRCPRSYPVASQEPVGDDLAMVGDQVPAHVAQIECGRPPGGLSPVHPFGEAER